MLVVRIVLFGAEERKGGQARALGASYFAGLPFAGGWFNHALLAETAVSWLGLISTLKRNVDRRPCQLLFL